ncbi:hypothetical protein SELMODRAFT_421461 [Selaginella moellendorffii]|uniref:Uncharacterized protein n=1 Tax=Selaginella moellendorffii TaxID=88036 RepID=D8SFC6_SELML|nr:hypothetical protein SELMODRAFT_421461 [Selaginella moellendorffii]
MARTEQERCGCVTGLWSLFRPKKAHKGDNKVHPEAMDAAASKLKVQDRVCEAVSGEAMDAAALKLKELRHEVKIVLEAIRQERPIKPIKPEQEKEDEEENQEKKVEQLKEEKKAVQVTKEEKEADQMKPMKLEQEEENEAEKQLKEEEQGHKEQPQLEREEKNQPNQPIKQIKPMKQEQEQEEEQRMKPMKQQLEQEEEQTIKPIKQPLEREDDQEKMKQQENDKPKQEEQRPKPILLPAGGRRPGSRPKMVRFSSSAEDILPDGTRRRSETHLSDGRGGYVEFTYLEALHKANRWLNQRGKTEKKIRSLEGEKHEETEEEKYEEKSWSVSALRILIRLTEQLYEELNGKSSDRERIKRARKMMRLQKMLDRIPSERKPWKKLQSGEVVFVKEAKELYDRAGRDFVAEFKRRQNHDGEKMIGRAGVNSKATRPWVYLRREHEQTVLSTSKKREMKLAPSSRTVQDVKAARDDRVSGLQAETSITLQASKQASDQPPHSSKSREDQWIKFDYTLQCLEQGGIYLISFPVDGDETGDTAAECSYSCSDESISKELSVRLLQGKSNPKVGAGKLGAVAKYARKSRTTVADGGRDGESKPAVDEAPGGAVGWKCSRVHQTSASKQARDPPPHSSKSREDQWIKLGYTLQCLEQGGIYLIGFPVDGDDSGAPAAVRLSMIVARNDVNQCQMAARWREDDIAEAARDWGFRWLRRL